MAQRTVRPKFRLTCGACRRQIALAADVYLVDHEWERRYPRKMSGRIICLRCSNEQQDRCTLPSGAFIDGHVRVEIPGRTDIDLVSHLLRRATQRAAVMRDPVSGVAQGAREWVLVVLTDERLDPSLRESFSMAVGRRKSGHSSPSSR